MEIDEQDPGKVFVLEVFKTMAAHLPSPSTNGSSARTPREGPLSDSPGGNGSTPENNDRSRLEE
jgi:hypothetical protein